MTPKTSRQVITDIYNFFKDSTLCTMISGEVYRSGMRPRGSKAEDAVVTFVTGLVGETPSGVVVVNIYVPDVDPYHNGVLVEDSARTQEIEAEAARWVQSLTCAISNYKFRLAATIQTFEETSTAEHFVTIRLGYDYWEE